VTHKATGVKYAVKCLDLGLVETEEGLQQLREEIFIMCQLDHPNIVRLEEVYESHSEIYLVQELCVGGELFDRLDEQPDYHYTEAECARLVKQMLCAVRYLHSKGIIHRDMKLENFLFSSSAPDSELKMIDFGLSKHFKFGEIQHEAVGTPYTVAPEVIRGSYDERCDIWAVGVIAFLLLSGDPPFGGCGGPEPLLTVRSNILRGHYSFQPKEIWDLVSVQAKEFIKSLLVIEPYKRPTAREAQKNIWLKDWANRGQGAEDKMLNPNVVKALVNFKEFSDMRKLLCEVLSFTLLPDQIKDLRKEFEKMDTDGSGEISLKALKHVLLTNASAGSLGALTEEEVEDIFNAMRVRKSETRIHWHEFIAAGLSQCQVDDRNLRLAFDRLDHDHKGYITFENVMDLMGNDAFQSEDAMRKMWGDSMAACNCNHARICYDDFLLLMKGQTKEVDRAHIKPQKRLAAIDEALLQLEPVQEVNAIGEDEDAEKDVAADGTTSYGLDLGHGGSGQIRRSSAPGVTASSSPPITPVFGKVMAPSLQLSDDAFDEPLSMDDDDVVGDLPVRPLTGIGSFTPPASPHRGPMDYTTPNSGRKMSPSIPEVEFVSLDSAGPLPKMPVAEMYRRTRSRSVDDQQENGKGEEDKDAGERQSPGFESDTRRAMMLPEHEHEAHIEKLIHDESKTPLVVNRQLYRAHRQMRVAVIEATKRFEEEQTRRAREILESLEGKRNVGAGLVMRHGLKKQISTQAVRDWLKKSQEEQAKQLDLATKRGGRGKSRRKKTISDMTGMLSDLSSDISSAERAPLESIESGSFDVMAPVGTSAADEMRTKLGESDSILNLGSVDLDDFPPIREATVPGVFRVSKDPFSMGGRYGL
jgi:calcium-dependent protein kinase